MSEEPEQQMMQAAHKIVYNNQFDKMQMPANFCLGCKMPRTLPTRQMYECIAHSVGSKEKIVSQQH